jgi:hypothetical protein
MAEIDIPFDQLYGAFNARDADAVLAHMSADVEWPKAFDGGYVRGTDGVRDYWHRQWGEISPTVTPRSVTRLPDGRVDVEVDQVVRDLSGALLDERVVHHIYTLDGGAIVRMDIEA